jgi:Amidohydrolase family
MALVSPEDYIRVQPRRPPRGQPARDGRHECDDHRHGCGRRWICGSHAEEQSRHHPVHRHGATLSLWRYELRNERISLADGFEETAIGQLRAWSLAGGIVLFGTDVGYMTAYDPTEEYVLMAKAGMTFPQILASLTTAPAERFGASRQAGRIAPGLAADLTVLRHDPAKDIRAFTAVEYTVRNGKIIFRAPR